MKIKEIIDDIAQDLDTIEQRTEESRQDGPWINRNQTSGAYLQILVPHIIGFVLGLAIARMLELGMTGYIALGSLFAIFGGVYKSVSFDGISLKPAIIRNLLLTAPVFIFFLVVYHFSK